MLNFNKITCKNIMLRKILISDIDNIRLVRKKGEDIGVLSKTSKDKNVFSKWLNMDLKNSKSLYLAILDLDHNFIGTVRLIDLDSGVFEWGSWALKGGENHLISLNCAYAVYKIANEMCNFAEAEIKVKQHNKNVIRFHLNSGAKILQIEDDLIHFRIDKPSILLFLQKLEPKFGSLIVI